MTATPALSPLRRVLRIGPIWGFLLLCLLCLAAGMLAVLYYAYSLPLLSGLEREPAQPSLLLAADDGTVFASRGIFRGKTLTFQDLPEDLVHAVVAIEDRRFFDHGGIDFRSVLRAASVNLRSGQIEEGGSTITQQLAKITFFSPERSFRRKIQEALVALWLEHRLGKEKILARYLDSAYFGAGAYGADGAARRYFNKSVKDLTLSECALLAGLIRAPSALALTHNAEEAQKRSALVLHAMLENGYLTEEQAGRARASPAELAVRNRVESGHNYFADWIHRQTRRALGAFSGDLRVSTTLDPALQRLAERTIAEMLDRREEELKVSQAGLVAMTPDGAVVAMVGGRAYEESQFNRATQAQRQPGSLFKLFVYLAALGEGLTPDSTLVDKPVTVEGWTPKNYTGQHLGPVTARKAFAKSINSVAVQLAEQVGRDKVIAMARKLGVSSELAPTPSLALGASEVTLLEMTAAYAAVAANRDRVEPYGIRQIRSQNSQVAGEGFAPARALAGTPSWNRNAALDLLLATVSSGTGRAAALETRVAGKTGTTQDYRDAWFIGFTGGLVVGIWVGNDDNSPMQGVTGGNLPARTWHDFVAAALELKGDGISGQDLALVSPVETEIELNLQARTLMERKETAPLPEVASTEPGKRKPIKERQQKPMPTLQGVPRVLDTGNLLFDFEGRIAPLVGVEGQRGRFAEELAGYLGNRVVTCRPFDRRTYNCEVGGYDLSEVVLFNGGGRLLPGAPAYLVAAERHAQDQSLGIWR